MVIDSPSTSLEGSVDVRTGQGEAGHIGPFEQPGAVLLPYPGGQARAFGHAADQKLPPLVGIDLGELQDDRDNRILVGRGVGGQADAADVVILLLEHHDQVAVRRYRHGPAVGEIGVDVRR